MNDYNQSFSRLRLTSLGDQELHRNQEIARESSRQLTVLLAEGTKQFDKKQLQMVKVGKDGPGQEFRTNLAAFSKFLCQFWETKWLDGLVAPEFAEQKDLAVKLMDDLQKPKNLCPWCQVSYFGTHCMKCNRCPCGYYAHQHVRCAHFGGSCQRCGATAFQQGTFCESCGYCVHGRHQSYGQGCGCKSQTRKKAKTAKTAETCKTALDSAQKKLDHEATSREQLTELASMADTLAKLCRKDAKVMETAEKEFQKKMVLLKAFAEAINDVPKVLRCFLLFRCGAIKEDPTSLKEWLSKVAAWQLPNSFPRHEIWWEQLTKRMIWTTTKVKEFRDEAGEADRAVRVKGTASVVQLRVYAAMPKNGDLIASLLVQFVKACTKQLPEGVINSEHGSFQSQHKKTHKQLIKSVSNWFWDNRGGWDFSMRPKAVKELTAFIAAKGGSIRSSGFLEFQQRFPALAQVIYSKGGTLRGFCQKHSEFLVEDNPDEPGCRIHLKAASNSSCGLTTKWVPKPTAAASLEAHLPVPAAQASGTSAGPAAQDDDSESSSSECGDAPEPGTIELPASQIRWAHNSIKVRFRNGMLLVDTLKELLDGSLKPHQLPAFFVWQRGNTWFAITGNRRLWVLRELAEISAAEVFVRARRRLNPGVHLSPWFRNMFTTDCDGRLQVAQELQQLPDPVLLADLEQRFAGQFSVGEVVHSKPNLFRVTWGNGLQVALARPPNLHATTAAVPKPAAPMPPPPKAPPSAPMGPLQDPWASGRDPLSQSLEASASDRAEAPRWKAPPLSRPAEAEKDPWTAGKDPWSAAASFAAPGCRSPARPRTSDCEALEAVETPAPPPKPKPPPPPVPSSSEESEAEPQPNRAGSSADSDSEDSDLMKEPEEAGYANAASQDPNVFADIADWPKRFPSRGFAVAALRAHTAPTQTDMAVGQILCSVPGGSLTEQELIERCQAKLVGSSKRFKKLYWKRYWVQKSHLFTAKGTKVAFAPPLPVIYEGQDVLPEGWRERFPSEGFALASVSAPVSKADMQIGWILKRAGGQLDRMTIRDHLNRDLLAEHLKGGGSSTPPPMQKLKPKDFWPKPHLFVFSDRTDLVSFAVPPRLVRPQDGCHSAGEKGTGSRDDGSSKSAGNGAASGGEGSRQSPTFTGSDASSVPSSKTVAEAEVQMAQPQPVPKQPIETKGVHCKVHKHSHMGLAIVSVQSASIREAIFRLLQSRSGCNDGQAQLCIGDVRVELKRQVVCRQEVVTGIFVAWGRQQEKDCPLAAESIATTFDQLTQEALAFSTTPSANQLGHKSSTPQAAAPGDSSRTRMCLQTSLPAPVEAVPVRGVDNAGGLEPVLGKSQQSPPGVWQQSPPLLKPGQGQRCICNLGGLLSKLPPKIFQTMDVRAYAHALHAHKAQRLIFQSGWPVQVALGSGWLASGVLPDVRLMQEDLEELMQRLGLQIFVWSLKFRGCTALAPENLPDGPPPLNLFTDRSPLPPPPTPPR
ncbi:unnamed protein product [Symbiodinium microadriaticum]|nr:unnamed protein product [Symbiodinium microadriaticum]